MKGVGNSKPYAEQRSVIKIAASSWGIKSSGIFDYLMIIPRLLRGGRRRIKNKFSGFKGSSIKSHMEYDVGSTCRNFSQGLGT